MIAVVDYGVGNLGSALKAFRHVGADAVLSGDPGVLQSADALVLPGDGAFGATMDEIEARGLTPLLRAAAQQKKPLLGICVGMQVLFEDSDEQGAHRGLSLLRGSVRRLRGARVVPHMGWNTLDFAARRAHPILDGVADGAYAYFVHSYACAADADSVVATTSYGEDFAAIVAAGSIVAMQFHPEKSQAVGLRLIENFVRWSRA